MPDEEVLTEPNDTEPDNTENNNEEETDMPETTGKLKRSALMHFLNTAFSTSLTSPDWYLIGKDVEDMSVELNPDTETTKNILDETSITDRGYEPSVSVDTYFANPDDGDIYDQLKDIAMNRKTDGACRTLVLEVLVDKTTGPFDAWVEEAIIKPTSYGGAQGGVRIPYTISFSGNRQAGTVTFTNKVPAFTAST